jgi:hypothetical protein
MTAERVGSDAALASHVVRAGFAVIDGAACAGLWPILRRELDRHARDGGRVRPEMRAAVEAMRAAALEFVSANGHPGRTFADIGAESLVSDVVSTAVLADRLGVSARHARRIAAAAGISPRGRGWWAREDVDLLTGARAAAP